MIVTVWTWGMRTGWLPLFTSQDGELAAQCVADALKAGIPADHIRIR